MPQFRFGASSLANRAGVDQRLVEISDLALTISKIDFGIPRYGGLRTVEDQQQLFNDGKSKADGVKKKSKHQSGLALDFYAFVDGKASWDTAHLTHIAAAMLQAASKLGYKISWGGFWKSFIDMPHIQLEE